MSDLEAIEFAKEHLNKISYQLECQNILPCRTFYEKQQAMLIQSVVALEKQISKKVYKKSVSISSYEYFGNFCPNCNEELTCSEAKCCCHCGQVLDWRGGEIKIDEAIQEFEDNAYHQSLKPVISDCAKTLALKALQKKQLRDKECNYCNGNNPSELPGMGENTIYYHSRYGKFYSGCDELEWKNCPICGRKLSEEK
jgi:hypothetical protein